MEGGAKKSTSGAHGALLLLLGINLFNYIDRQVLPRLSLIFARVFLQLAT